MNPPADDVTDGLLEEVVWPCVTAAYKGVAARPPERVDGPCVTPSLEAAPELMIDGPCVTPDHDDEGILCRPPERVDGPCVTPPLEWVLGRPMEHLE